MFLVNAFNYFMLIVSHQSVNKYKFVIKNFAFYVNL